MKMSRKENVITNKGRAFSIPMLERRPKSDEQTRLLRRERNENGKQRNSILL